MSACGNENAHQETTISKPPITTMTKIARKITEAKRMHPPLHSSRSFPKMPRRRPDVAVLLFERHANAPDFKSADLFG